MPLSQYCLSCPHDLTPLKECLSRVTWSWYWTGSLERINWLHWVIDIRLPRGNKAQSRILQISRYIVGLTDMNCQQTQTIPAPAHSSMAPLVTSLVDPCLLLSVTESLWCRHLCKVIRATGLGRKSFHVVEPLLITHEKFRPLGPCDDLRNGSRVERMALKKR